MIQYRHPQTQGARGSLCVHTELVMSGQTAPGLKMLNSVSNTVYFRTGVIFMAI